MTLPASLQWLKSQKKIINMRTRIWFLNQCKCKRLVPNFIQNNLVITTDNQQLRNLLLKETQKKWINLEIRNAYSNLDRLNTEAYFTFQEIDNECDKHD